MWHNLDVLSSTRLHPLIAPQQPMHLVCISLQLMIVIKGVGADRHPLLPDFGHAAAIGFLHCDDSVPWSREPTQTLPFL